MPIQVVHQDITKVKADAIVCASGHDLRLHGMSATAVFDAAGPGLQQECDRKGFIDTAEVFVTGAYRLPAKYVLHTVGPEFRDGHSGEALLLAQCYRNCMAGAWEAGCRSIAFPLISSGGYRFPKENALSTAMNAIASSEYADEMDVILTVYDRGSYEVSREMLEEIRDFLDSEDDGKEWTREEEIRTCASELPPEETEVLYLRKMESVSPAVGKSQLFSQENSVSYKSEAEMLKELKEAMRWKDENFSESIKRLIRERDMKPSDCYHAANISKAVFSNIINKPEYKPAKTTAFAFAVAFRLSVQETKELLAKAGFAMSGAFPLDRAMEYLIAHHVYNIHDVNAMLFELDLPELGEKYG